MRKIIFDHTDYKLYLATFIKSQVGHGRGWRARMAEAMDCQKGFITKVLAPDSPTHLSLEQAAKLNSLLNHSEDEANFFYLLVQFARAGNKILRDHFRGQMKQTLNRRLAIRKDLESQNILSVEDHMRYYSFWYYAAIRMCVSVPGLQTIEALRKKLNLPAAKVTSALDFLTSRGLVEKKGDRFVHSQRQQIMLAADHPMVVRNHGNWRLQALKSLESEAASDLHYTYVVSLSESDALKIRSFLVETIKEMQARAAPSAEESVYAFCLDYFEV